MVLVRQAHEAFEAFGSLHPLQNLVIRSSRHMSSQKLTNNPSVPLFRLAIDDIVVGFLINGDAQQVIWVPAHLRGDALSVHRNIVVIGGDNGALTFIRFDSDL